MVFVLVLGTTSQLQFGLVWSPCASVSQTEYTFVARAAKCIDPASKIYLHVSSTLHYSLCKSMSYHQL